MEEEPHFILPNRRLLFCDAFPPLSLSFVTLPFRSQTKSLERSDRSKRLNQTSVTGSFRKPSLDRSRRELTFHLRQSETHQLVRLHCSLFVHPSLPRDQHGRHQHVEIEQPAIDVCSKKHQHFRPVDRPHLAFSVPANPQRHHARFHSSLGRSWHEVNIETGGVGLGKRERTLKPPITKVIPHSSCALPASPPPPFAASSILVCPFHASLNPALILSTMAVDSLTPSSVCLIVTRSLTNNAVEWCRPMKLPSHLIDCRQHALLPAVREAFSLLECGDKEHLDFNLSRHNIVPILLLRSLLQPNPSL
ncbi:hypothetical protein BLNAU_14928 [Blattamonas nauphoetae]|uniref:Uncharacterized protein n=1 Tax=Blattamonas nauphoetae TaxID=2049346 RepID=A0ABQ9XIM8_9EUKA|nr:hypothetical protein BLNAU_14928 [Blattamonas nauphoetae]